MRNGRQQGTPNTTWVEYESPPSIASCGQNTKCIMGCTNAPEQGSDGNIVASHNNCANTMTTMDGLQLPFLTDLGKEATGSLHNKLCQQNKWLRLVQQKLQKVNMYWTEHKGTFFIPDNILPLSMYRSEMRPKGLTLDHPAAKIWKSMQHMGVPHKLANLGPNRKCGRQ